MGMDEKSDGAVAQSVEQRTENPCVAGSIPAPTTKTSTIVEVFYFNPSYLFVLSFHFH